MNDPDPPNETPAFDSRDAISDEDVRGFCERAMAERRRSGPFAGDFDSAYGTDPQRSGLQFPDDPE